MIVAEKENISAVAKARLCNTCGACMGVCSSGAVHYEETAGGYYLPVADEAICVKCGLCYEVCPGVHFGDWFLSNMAQDPFAGCVLETFVGKASDRQLFDNSQSGGVVSAILLHALKTGVINGAVTVTMEAGNPPRPVARIVQDKQGIVQAQKSKYCPVPVLGFLKDLNSYDGKLAVVGTSCQIHGLRNVLDRKPNLKNRIAFTIGLVCERVLTYAALDYLVDKVCRADKGLPKQISFRDKTVSGYPGDVRVSLNDGQYFTLPAKKRIQIKDYFTPVRCRLCFDKMNVFADISAGDPYGLEGVDRKYGETMIAVRSKTGQEIVQAARVVGEINIRPVAYEQVLKGQGISKKKQQWSGYTRVWINSGRELPCYYGQVKRNLHAGSLAKRYKKDIEYALNLDGFASRAELIRYVNKALRKRKVLKLLLTPVRIVKNLMKKR